MASMPRSLTAEALIHGMIACRQNAEELMVEADLLSGGGRHARAYALLHTACEELGKFAILEIAARQAIQGKAVEWKQFWKRFRSHESKSAQLQVQLLILAASSYDTAEFTDLSEILFGPELYIRNASLYVDLGPDGSFRKPANIDFDVPTPGLRALTARSLAAASKRGSTLADIQAQLKAAPSSAALRTARHILMQSLQRARDAGVEKEKALELINRHYK